MKIKLILLIIVIGISSGYTQSLDEKLKVIKDYSDQIYAVNPLFDYRSIKIPLDVTESESRKGDTLVQLGIYNPNVDITIKPLAYPSDPGLKPYNGFIKMDKGTTNPLGLSGSYVHSVDNYFNMETAFNYDRWNETQKENKSIEEMEGNLALKYYVNDEILSTLNVTASQSKYGIYGSQFLVVNEQNTSVNYSRFGAEFKLASFRSGPNRWNYEGVVNFTRTALQGDDIDENSFRAKGSLQRNISSTLGLKIEGISNLSSLTFSDKVSAVQLNMTSQIRSKKWYGSLGASVNVIENIQKFFPIVDIKYQVNKEVSFFVSVNERIVLYGLDRLSRMNPYISKEYTNTFGSRNKEIQLGIVSPLSRTAVIKLATSVNRMWNAPIFHTPDLLDNRFIVEHVNYDFARLAIDVSKEFTNQWKADLSIDYAYYANETSPLYHLPKLRLEPSIQWRSSDKRFSFTLKGKFQDQTLLFDNGLIKKTSSYRKNISAAVSYSLLNRLDIYLNIDNVLNDQFEVWNGYDVFERNISGGVLVRI